MADRAGLEMLGFIFGGVTALVIAIAAFVVHTHVNVAVATAAVEQSAVPASLSARR